MATAPPQINHNGRALAWRELIGTILGDRVIPGLREGAAKIAYLIGDDTERSIGPRGDRK